MCGRYYLADYSDEEVKQYYAILRALNIKTKTTDYTLKVKTKGEIFPTDIVPVIANNKNKETSAFPMKWGYSYKDNKRPIINTRSETASEKWMFKDGMLQKRCLIPASYYFEWEKQATGKVKHAINPTGVNMMFIAGIYRLEKENSIPVFSILTRDVAPKIAFIHDRMPVILPVEAHEDWLNIEYDANDVIKAALMEMEHRIA